jgi:Zn-dependent protease with chaperone function
MADGAGFWRMTEGLGVSLSLQSFAARALLGSIVAAVLAAVCVRLGLVRTGRARRTLVLAPVAAACAAALACTAPGSSFLPALVVSATEGQPFEVFGEPFTVRRLEWLLVGYVAVATFLLLRRAIGHWAIRRYVGAATPATDLRLLAVVRRVSSKLGIEAPPLLLVRRCPGGAFTAGVRHPVVAVDPLLLDDLDDREVEGLLAHELAHIARRDVLLNTVVGVIRDLTFFVPPLGLAGRWLRLEQEHSADDLASDSTGRPAALASSILKVWQGSGGSGRGAVVGMACATMVPATALPLPAGVPAGLLRRGGLTGGAKQIAERVVRLIERGAPPTLRRQRTELAAAMAAVLLATGVTVVLPAQVSGELLLAQWTRPPERPVESPAIASFRHLASTAPPTASPTTSAATTASIEPAAATAVALGTVGACAECILLESGSQWRSGTAPTPPDRAPGWQLGGRVWAQPPEGLPVTPSAQALWGVDSRDSRVGLFLVHRQQR